MLIVAAIPIDVASTTVVEIGVPIGTFIYSPFVTASLATKASSEAPAWRVVPGAEDLTILWTLGLGVALNC